MQNREVGRLSRQEPSVWDGSSSGSKELPSNQQCLRVKVAALVWVLLMSLSGLFPEWNKHSCWLPWRSQSWSQSRAKFVAVQRKFYLHPQREGAILRWGLALAATGSFLISSYSRCVWGPQFSHPMPTNFSCPSPPAMCVRAECHLISVWRHVLTFLLVWGRCSSAWGTGYREVLSEEHASFI